jgi:hypothetical protein
VVCATTLQFPSNGEAIADGVTKTVAEAATRKMAQIRLPIIGVLQFPFAPESGLLNQARQAPDHHSAQARRAFVHGARFVKFLPASRQPNIGINLECMAATQ